MIARVEISKRAQSDIRRLPAHVVRKLMAWVDGVESLGLETMRTIPGYHDEPLHGDRKGQSSIRLSRSDRAIYRILRAGTVEYVQIEEVTRHAY